MLAPAAYYATFDLRALEACVDRGVRALGHAAGAKMTFAFDVLADALARAPLPDDGSLLRALDGRLPLHD